MSAKTSQNKVERQTYNLWPEAGGMMGLSRGATYAAADRGDIPTVIIGGRKLVPKRPFHKMLGMEDS